MALTPEQQSMQQAMNDLVYAFNSFTRNFSSSAANVNGTFNKVSTTLNNIDTDVDYIERSLKDRVKNLSSAATQERTLQSQRRNSLEEFIAGETNLFGKKLQMDADHLRDTLRAQNEFLITGDEYQQKLKEQYTEANNEVARLTKKRIAIEASITSKLAALNAKKAADLAAAGADLLKRAEINEQAQQQEEQILNERKEYEEELNAAFQRVVKINNVAQEVETSMQDVASQMEKTKSQLDEIRLGEKFEKWAEGLFSGFKTFVAGLAAKTFYDTIQTARVEMARSGGIGSIFEGQTAGLGMSRPEYAEMMGEYRRTALAMGGLQKTTDELSASQDDLYKFTGDMKEATEVSMMMFDTMTKAGIKASNDRLRKITPMFESLAKSTGITLRDFASIIKDVTEDDAVQTQLRMAATQDEREQILLNTARRVDEYKAMGMTIEQAKAATIALNKLAGQGPKERFKKGVQMQAMMGAMGVAGGEDIARIMTKPKSKWTAEDERAMAQATTGLSNRMAEVMGGENLGAAMATEAMGEKLGLTEESLKEFNTNAVEPLKDEINANTKMLEMVNKGWVAVIGAFDWLKNQLINNPIASMLAVGVGLGASLLLVGKHLGGLLTIFKSANIGQLLGKGGGKTPTVGGAAQPGGGMLGGLADGLSKLSNPKLFIGVGVLAALALPLWTAGKALQEFANVGWADVGKGIITLGGLALVAAGLSAVSGPMLVGAAAITVLGGALWVTGKAMQEFATGFQQFADVKWDQLSTGLASLGMGLGILWDESPGPAKLTVLGASLFGFGMSLMPLIGGLSLLDNTKLRDLAVNLNNLANINTDKLNKVADSLERIKDANSPTVTSLIKDAASALWNVTVGKQSGDIESKTETEAKEKTDATVIERQMQQIALMQNANNHLKVVADNVPTLVEIANKQLLAMSLTEKEKGDSNRIGRIRRDSGFGATYQYL